MSRRLTLGEKRWSPAAEFVALSGELVPMLVERLLAFLWEGLSGLKTVGIGNVEVTGEEEELERSLNLYLAPLVQDAIPAAFPLYVQHAPREFESRKAAPAQAPEYDLAFIVRASPRVMFPVEAKVLRTPYRTAEYVREIMENFVTCRYSPFSSEAAMVGYLVRGTPDEFFRRLEQRLLAKLETHPAFPEPEFAQRWSRHGRVVPDGKEYPRRLVLHHLVLRMN